MTADCPTCQGSPEAPQPALGAEELWERHAELEAQLNALNVELFAVESALRDGGHWTRPGRPRKAPTYTSEEAKEAQRLWMNGKRSTWIDAGHRQYERDRRRANRKA